MPEYFLSKENGFEYDVIRRKRKTMEIRVESPGKVLLIVPEKSKEQDILQMLDKHSNWVMKKLEIYQNVESLERSHLFCTGEQFWLQGAPVFLETIANPGTEYITLKVAGNKLIITAPVCDPEYIRIILVDWFKQRCQEVIQERVAYYEPLVQRTPTRVRAKEQKKRWGSCTAAGHLYFNWRLIGAPPVVLDYVVVHEMCHLVHLNHSPAFWKLVECLLPDYKIRQEWLRIHGRSLNF